MAKKTSNKTAAEKELSVLKTNSRKEARVAKNEARHQANLAYIAEHNLSPILVDKQVRILSKGKNKEVIESFKTVTRKASPGTVVQRHKNSLDDTRRLAWEKAQQGSPLEPSASTARHLRAKKAAELERKLKVVN